MNLKTNLANKANYGGKRSLSAIKFIVLHYTGNDGDTDENNGKYFANNVVKTSAHYFVDDDSVTQSVPDNYTAYHCGAKTYKHKTCRNSNSIGVEICDDVKNGTIYPSAATIANAVELVKSLMAKYNIPAANVIRHYDVTGKACPAYWCGNSSKDALWKNFKAMLEEKTEVKLQQYGAAFCNIEHLAWVYDGPETVSDAAKRVKWNGRVPDAICNAELFTSGYRAASGCTGNVTDTLGFAFVDGKRPELSYKNNRNAEHWIGSYPMLLRDGKTAFSAVPPGLGGKRARTALAISDTHFAFFYVRAKDGCTMEDLAYAILARGFHTAVNLDGGGSTACITPGVAYDQGRKVRGKIAMWVKGGKGNILKRSE